MLPSSLGFLLFSRSSKVARATIERERQGSGRGNRLADGSGVAHIRAVGSLWGWADNAQNQMTVEIFKRGQRLDRVVGGRDVLRGALKNRSLLDRMRDRQSLDLRNRDRRLLRAKVGLFLGLRLGWGDHRGNLGGRRSLHDGFRRFLQNNGVSFLNLRRDTTGDRDWLGFRSRELDMTTFDKFIDISLNNNIKVNDFGAEIVRNVSKIIVKIRVIISRNVFQVVLQSIAKFANTGKDSAQDLVSRMIVVCQIKQHLGVISYRCGFVLWQSDLGGGECGRYDTSNDVRNTPTNVEIWVGDDGNHIDFRRAGMAGAKGNDLGNSR